MMQKPLRWPMGYLRQRYTGGRAKAKSVDLRVSKRGCKQVLTPEDSERFAKAIDSQPTMYAVSDVFQMHQIQRTVSSFAAE